MNSDASRFSQAQVLIAALFAVVMTGEMPSETLPPKGDLRPLEEEFAEDLRSGRKLKRRVARACITWIDDSPQNWSYKNDVCTHLTRTRLMPCTVARLTRECMKGWVGVRQNRPGIKAYPGLAADVSARYGVDPRFVVICFERPREVEKAWHLCRAELLRIRAERVGGAK